MISIALIPFESLIILCMYIYQCQSDLLGARMIALIGLYFDLPH